jgi:hypothetical protein
VPRKCNTSNILIKIHSWLQDGQGQEIGGYDSTREGAKGAKSFYYYFIHPSWFYFGEVVTRASWVRPCGS